MAAGACRPLRREATEALFPPAGEGRFSSVILRSDWTRETSFFAAGRPRRPASPPPLGLPRSLFPRVLLRLLPLCRSAEANGEAELSKSRSKEGRATGKFSREADGDSSFGSQVSLRGLPGGLPNAKASTRMLAGRFGGQSGCTMTSAPLLRNSKDDDNDDNKGR